MLINYRILNNLGDRFLYVSASIKLNDALFYNQFTCKIPSGTFSLPAKHRDRFPSV